MSTLIEKRTVSVNTNSVPSNDPEKNVPQDVPSVMQLHIKPAFESTVCLVNQLVAHFSKDHRQGIHIRDKTKENVLQRQLKTLVFSVLLSYRKDYKTDNSVVKLTEVEDVIWQTFMLRQHRRYDDGNSLERCLQCLKEQGQLEAGSDVRNVLKFLVALKGLGGDITKKVNLAELTPRIVHVGKNQPSFLPSGPLQYGDTFMQSAEYRPHYMHFPPGIFSLPSSTIENVAYKKNTSPFEVESMIELSKAPPGTGISPMLLGRNQSEACGKVMGALLQKQNGEVEPDALLSIPELPTNAQGYSYFSHLPKTLPSPPSAVCSDEGYASSRAANLQTPEDDVEDVWEAVLKGPPLTSRRTWETLDHVPLSKEKLFLSEAGPDSSHNVWLLYQELWGSLGDHHVPSLYVRSMEQLCQDLLNLMIGVPSRSFLWSAELASFCVKDGLCYPGVTPEHLRGSLFPFVECGTLVRRLEVVCITPKFDTQHLLTQGSVFRAFTVAVSNVLQVYRGMVFSLSGETHLPRLQERAQHLLKKIKFVAHLFHISSNCYKNYTTTRRLVPDNKTTDTETGRGLQHTSVVTEGHQEMLRGLSLLGELLNQVILTKDQACLLLLMSIFKNACAPFFRYLEDWIYEGVCSDPGQEFMIDVDGRSLLKRDRSYWTNGYTLRDLSSIPPFLHDVLREAFTCGKGLNLLKLCSAKHHLVQAGSTKHPGLQVCLSGEELEQMQGQCEAYAAIMNYTTAQNQISARQKVELEIEEKQRLMVVSSEKQAEILKVIKGKMEDARQKEVEEKNSRFQELKEEMLKARERKQEEKQREAEEDLKIAQELLEKEAKKQEEEEKLRAKMESYYHKRIFAAERSETLARWKVQRCLLSEARKRFILQSDWSSCQKHIDNGKSQRTAETGIEETYITIERIEDTSPFNEQCLLPIVSHLEQNAHPRHLPKSLMNIEAGIDAQRQSNINENLVRENICHIDFVKESPNQDLSVSDMTPSLMSTSSDFIDTPHDENLPDFETDQKRFVNSEKNYHENKFSSVYGKSSIDAVLYDRSEDFDIQKQKGPTFMPVLSTVGESACNRVEGFGIMSDKTEGEYRLLTKDVEGQSSTSRIFGEQSLERQKLVAEGNGKVFTEDFGIGNSDRVPATDQDANANFPVANEEDDENGNSEKDSQLFAADDINANLASERHTTLPEVSSYMEQSFEDPNANIETLADDISTTQKGGIGKKSIVDDIKASGDDSNGNIISHSMKDAHSQYRDRCTQAAAIKQKVLCEEFHAATENKNTLNILRSKPVPSSLAVENKQRVLVTEYGITEMGGSGADKNTLSYSRQVSSASTSSYKSCCFFERQTSSSTAFTTPDEERPILIDQVGGEVLKERGRSVHGHASDAVIHKLLWKHNQEPVSPTEGVSDMTPIDDLLSAVRNSVLYKAEPYSVENLKLMGCEPLLDITGTALNGRPNTRQPGNKKLPPVPSTNELSCAPIYFIRSIRMHLATQSRLVNASLLSEVLVQESLLDHLSALRALLLLHDTHFARALTLNLSSKVNTACSPAALLVPVELNNILNRSIAESCWSTSQQAENLSFAIKSIPPAFTHTTSVVDCLDLRYHVRWPHTLILDDAILASYSQVWNFLASLHYSIWTADDLFHHLSTLSRQDKAGHFLKCSQYHQVCLYRHEMHHFLLVVQAYVISQVHQISWSKFEQKLHEKVSSLDDLYDLHRSLVTSINSRCFLTHNGAVVQKLVRDVFSLMLRFRSQYLSHSWQANTQSGVMEHPGYTALRTTYQEFQKHSLFLHKLLVKVGQRIRIDHCQQDLLDRLDFNNYYSRVTSI